MKKDPFDEHPITKLRQICSPFSSHTTLTSMRCTSPSLLQEQEKPYHTNIIHPSSLVPPPLLIHSPLRCRPLASLDTSLPLFNCGPAAFEFAKHVNMKGRETPESYFGSFALLRSWLVSLDIGFS